MSPRRRSARLNAQAATAAMPPPPTPSRANPPITGSATESTHNNTAASKGRKRKATADAASEALLAPEDAPPAEPVTPPPKRRTRKPAPAPAPPSTPTPSAAGLMAEHLDGTPTPGTPDGTSSGNNGSITPRSKRTAGKAGKPHGRAVARLADPNSTNAALLSPETSRVVLSSGAAAAPAGSPSKAPPPAPKLSASSSLVGTDNHRAPTTTDNILERACAHLVAVDPRMKPLVDSYHCRAFSPEGLAEKIDPFESLCSGIISQQVSGAAAKSIKAKFVALFHDADVDVDVKADAEAEAEAEADADKSRAAASARRFPHPSQVASTKLDRLRAAGLSQRKAEYIQGLADKFAAGELSARMLAEAPYDEVLRRLIAVRGLGQWSVEMFACFALKRLDVFSLGDLGVQRGMAAFAGRDVAKLKSKGGKWKYMSEREMVEISERFAPYRSLFMWYMWRVEETDISTLE